MLKIYSSESDVPTELKDHYAEVNGKWEPKLEGVTSLSGLLAKRDELLGKVSGHATELAAKDAEIERLTGDLQNAKQNTVQRGHESVPKADAELARAVKAKGVETVEAFNTLHADHGTFKQQAEAATEAAHAAEVFTALGWDKEKAQRLVPKVFDLKTVKLKDGKDGKREVVALVKGDGDALVEKPFAEVVKATPELSDIEPLLKGDSRPVPGSPRDPAPKGPTGSGKAEGEAAAGVAAATRGAFG
jgi:hypothetical protein